MTYDAMRPDTMLGIQAIHTSPVKRIKAISRVSFPPPPPPFSLSLSLSPQLPQVETRFRGPRPSAADEEFLAVSSLALARFEYFIAIPQRATRTRRQSDLLNVAKRGRAASSSWRLNSAERTNEQPVEAAMRRPVVSLRDSLVCQDARPIITGGRAVANVVALLAGSGVRDIAPSDSHVRNFE